MNEVDKFFGDLPSEEKQLQDVFDNIQKPVENTGEVLEKGDEGVRKNRRERRLEDKMRQKDEMLIALNERVKVLSETVAARGEKIESTDVPADWFALYGNTDAAKGAWDMNARMFSDLKEQAKQEAIEEFENRQRQVIEEQKGYEAFIDSQFESLEDKFDVDLTSDAPAARRARREMLELVESLSPKNDEGDITDFADFESTFDVYRKTKVSRNDTTVSRQKEIAAQSMQDSGGRSAQSTQKYTPGFQGWKNDYGLN